MIGVSSLAILTIGYLLIIFFIAMIVEKYTKINRAFIESSVVYSLSLGVYCTAWTMFGSIQVAASNGMLFFAIYLGPALGALFWSIWLKKLIRIKNKFRITSLADFISARYNKSVGIGIMVTLFILIGFTPYIALQIKALISTTELLLQPADPNAKRVSSEMLEIFLMIGVALTAIIVGLRHLNPAERHPAMVVTLAFESLVKVFAALVGGAFVVYYLNDGIFSALETLPKLQNIENYKFMGATNASDFITWLSYLFLSMFAVLLLPRLFHISVIENSNEKHVKTAQWLFPAFLLLMNIFILPVAIFGMKAGLPASSADTFLLKLPMMSNNLWVTFIVYIGGFSACLGMMTASCTTISTMITNHLIIPLIDFLPRFSFLRGHILKLRWLSTVFLITAGYWYQNALGASAALVSIGMISFVAVFQFAPVVLGGLFWESASKKGAYFGIASGFTMWLYTLLLPAFAKSGLISSDFISNGLFGQSWLRPEALLGLEGLSPIAHSFLWTGFVNITGFVFGSLLFPASKEELLHAKDFLDTSDEKDQQLRTDEMEADTIPLEPKIKMIRLLLDQYINAESEVSTIIQNIQRTVNLHNKELISVSELAELASELEKTLAGAIGTASAHSAISLLGLFSEAERKKLAEYYSTTLSQLMISPKELKEKINYQKEKETMLRQYMDEIEKTLKERTLELERSQHKLIQSSKMASLGEMAGGVAHEVNTPLATISLCVDSMEHRILENKISQQDFTKTLNTMRRTVDRIAQIIRGLRLFSRGGENIPFETKEVMALVQDTIILCQDKMKAQCIELRMTGDPKVQIECRAVQVSQVILNLVGNSIDAIAHFPEKWIEIELKDLSERIQLFVTDCGTGIPKEIQDKIMQPFFTTKDLGKGTGLGLSISSGLIGSHGGKLYIDSGCMNTRFIIELPKKQESPSQDKSK